MPDWEVMPEPTLPDQPQVPDGVPWKWPISANETDETLSAKTAKRTFFIN